MHEYDAEVAATAEQSSSEKRRRSGETCQVIDYPRAGGRLIQGKRNKGQKLAASEKLGRVNYRYCANRSGEEPTDNYTECNLRRDDRKGVIGSPELVTRCWADSRVRWLPSAPDVRLSFEQSRCECRGDPLGVSKDRVR